MSKRLSGRIASPFRWFRIVSSCHDLVAGVTALSIWNSSRVRFVAGLVVAMVALPTSSSFGAERRPSPVELEDRPEPLVPQKNETAAQVYQRQALSYYGAGMMYEQQGNREEALKHYQRALRFDPDSPAILSRVVETAWGLERHQEAIRYALKAAEVGPANPELLERLAAFLVEEEKLEQATELYEKAASLTEEKKKTVGYVRVKLIIGQLYARQKKFDQAADTFAFVLEALQKPDEYGIRGRTKTQLEGEKGRTYLLIGETFLRADRNDLAKAAFERAFKVSPDAALEAYYQARLAEKQKKFTEAVAKLDAYFAAESDEAGTDAYELYERLLKETGKSAELMPKLEKLLKDDPKNIPLRYFTAGRYRAAGDFARAKPIYEDLLRRSPTLEVYEGLLESSYKTSDAAKQVEVLTEVTAKTNSLDAVKKFVETLIGDKGRLDAVITAGRKSADKSQPEDGRPVAFALALLALEAKQYGVAGEFFELALLHDPKNTSPIMLAWGLGLFGDEKYGDAAKVFHRAIESASNAESAGFQIYLSLALEFDGKTDEALSVARKAVEAGNNELRFATRIPWIMYHAKRYKDAAEAYLELIKKFDGDHKSDSDRQLLREARLALSNIYVHLEDMAKAEQPLEEVLDEFPDDIGAMNDLGYLWADQGKNLEIALEMVKKAVAKEPKNRAYRDSLGWVYYRLKRYAEAAAELEIAVVKDPGKDDPDGVILDHLGDVYHALGRHDDARKQWEKAAASFKKDDERAKLAETNRKLAKLPKP